MKAAIATAFLVASCSSSDARYDPAHAAEFRYYTRMVVDELTPLCPITERDAREYEPVQNRFSSLRDRLSGSTLATDLAIAEADQSFERSITLVECASPDRSSTEQEISASIARVSKNLRRMETFAEQQGVI